MFWKLTALSASSPVESVLDKENFTLEELLDEEEIIQECKALNSRLINFLRDREQVEKLLRYIVEEAPVDAESKQAFKFPFVACEIFTCEIDVILKTLVEEEELMNLLFSFLEPNRPHSALLAGYFSKVVVCLMLRKTVPLMNYVQIHPDVFRRLVDLIGITSIMEVLVRLVGADDHAYPNFMDVMQWLADSNLLEMIVDKLSPLCPPEVHANAAETLCAITRNAPSALATKLSSPSFVARIFGHALEDSRSKSSLVHSLSVCISLLDPKRSAIASPLMYSFRSQHMYESPNPVNPETIGAMLPKLCDLLMLLNVSSDEKVLETTYGELRPPLGKHRLKQDENSFMNLLNLLERRQLYTMVMSDLSFEIVEFIAVLLRTSNEAAEQELVSSGTIKRILDLFFEKTLSGVSGKLMSCKSVMQWKMFTDGLAGMFLLHYRYDLPSFLLCIHISSRPTALQDRTKDSDDDDLHDRDYDVAALANNLSQAFRYKIYGNEDAEEDHGALDRDDEVLILVFTFIAINDKDVYFDDESAEVVISSLRLGDDQGRPSVLFSVFGCSLMGISLFTNSNWFAFQDDRIGNAPVSTSPSEMMDEVNLNGTANGGNSSSDDEVVVGEDDELTESKDSVNGTSTSDANYLNTLPGSASLNTGDLNSQCENANASQDLGFFRFDTPDNIDLFAGRPLPDWEGWGGSSDMQVSGSSLNPFIDHDILDVNPASHNEAVTSDGSSPSSVESTLPNGSSTSMDSSDGTVSTDGSQRCASVPSLFEEDVEFVGVELEGTERAMEQALKEGIVGEAGPLKRNIITKVPEKENPDESGAAIKEFNDANYWRVDQEVAVLE
ncbi:hypothetical protein CUMW_036240 [Citrus unshiu]|nr:hypothetical protein CUMW_036240 [Citrus unshiu]